MILPAQTIREMCLTRSDEDGEPRPMIAPFCERFVVDGISGGLSAAGYDIRIAEDHLIWPRGTALASTIECFDLPNDVTMKIEDKSTWARRKMQCFNTTGEPGWVGFLTIELVNHSWRFIRLRAGTPIAQACFHRLEGATEQPYQGKYQYQKSSPQRAILEV